MTNEQQTIDALQQEIQRLRQQITVISHERDLCRQQTQLEQTSDVTAHVLHPFLDGPVILFKWAAREDWPVEYVSPNVARFGYTPNDFMSGRIPYPTIVYPDDLERVGGEVAQYSAEGYQFFEQEYRLLNAEGDPRWIYDYTSIIRDSDGTITHYVGYVLDTTERKAQEEELRMFKDLIENAPDGFAIADMHGTMTYVNPGYRAPLGWDDSLIGQPLHTTLAEEPQRLHDLIQHVMTEGRWQGELRYRRKDGSTFPGQASSFVLYDANGQPQAIAGIMRDITQRKREEAERETLQQQVIEAQREALRELSTPLIPLSNDVVIMPLIGAIDSGRAQMVMETLLEGVAHYRAELVILDITGVSVVDTQVAQSFVQAAQAVRLLGAQVMLTGIGPEIAQTLVHLGVDLSGIQTRGSLQSGIAAALHTVGEHNTRST